MSVKFSQFCSHNPLASVLLTFLSYPFGTDWRLLSGNEPNVIQSPMSKHKLEYIWLDGYKPTQSLRGKTMIVEDFSANSRTPSSGPSMVPPRNKPPGRLRLPPSASAPYPTRSLWRRRMVGHVRVLNADGTPHESNGRPRSTKTTMTFGLVSNRNIPLSTPRPTSLWVFPRTDTPDPKDLTTPVGARNTKGELIDEHLHLCLEAA